MRAAAPGRAGPAQGLGLEVRRGTPLPPRPIVAQALRRDLLASILDPLDEQHQQQLPGWRRGGTAAASTTVSAAAAPGSVRQRRWRRLVRAGAEAGTRQQGPPLLLEQLPQPIAPAAKRHPSAAEQRELARAAGAGDERAVAALVDANRALVHFLARRFLGKGLAREDLVSEGMLALERAARRYRPQPGRDASFGTFAAATILNGMSRALHTQSRDVRLPVHHFRDMARVRQATLELATEQLRQPECGEIAERCSFDISYTLHLLRAMGSQVGQSPLMQVLDQEMAAPMDQDPTQQGGVSLDGLEVLLEDEVAAEERSQLIEAELRSCLARLEPQQVSVVELRHGLDGEGLRRTWKEVGECLGRSGSWASMQYKVAERKMKAFMCADEQQQPHSPPARRSGQRSRSSSRRSSRSEARPPISALETCAERMAGVQGRAVDAQLAVADALASLKPTEQLVVALRHGWVDGTAELVMFKDVGTRMKRTLNGASNLYKKAESVLRARLEALGHADLELGQLRFSQQQREAWQRQLEGLPCKPSRRGAAGGSRPARSATGKAGGALEAAEPAELAAAGGGKAEQGVPQQQQAPEADPEPAASSSTRPPPGEGRQQAPAAEAGGPGPSTGTEAGSPSGQAAAAPAAAPSVLSNAAVAVPPSWQPRAEAAARLLSQWQLMVVRAAEPRALAVR